MVVSPARGRLDRYSLYQMQDFLTERGVYAVVVGLLVGWTSLLEMRGAHGDAWRTSPMSGVFAMQGIKAALNGFAFLGVLLTSTGVIANDRKHGYYRFLFTKPVSVVRYYFQAWLVSGAGLLVVCALLIAVWNYVAAPVAPWGLLQAMAIYFVLVGGVAFLMSSLVRFDWVATASVWGLTQVLRSIYETRSGVLAWAVNHLLPPTHRLMDVLNALPASDPVDRAGLAWILGYGVVCMVLGLTVVRFRPMGR